MCRTPASLAMDVWRSGHEYRVALDLPGVGPDSVDITVERDVVSIRAERRQEFGQDVQVLLAEQPQGQFARQLMLGEAAGRVSGRVWTRRTCKRTSGPALGVGQGGNAVEP